MGYLNIFLVCFVCSFSLLTSGKLFNKYLIKQNETNFFEYIIFGFILNSFLALFINFFFSLNEKLNLIFIIFPIIFYLYINKSEIKKDIKYLFLISILSLLILALDNTNRPDAGLYHLPYIGILNESNLIVGLSNLHFRYGHISIIQYISSIYNNIFFGDNGILIPTSIIFLSMLGYIILEAKKHRNDKFYHFLAIIFSSYILINMNRYSSWGNDDFASIMMFIIVLNIYKNFLKFEESSFAKTILFCSFVFFIKSFYIIIFLLPVILFLKNYKSINKYFILNKTNYFNFLFVIIWLFKNFLTSSCLIFPVSFLCFDIFSWSLTQESIGNISLISEAWAKDWPNNNGNYNYLEFVRDFNWFNAWINNHFFIILKNIFPLLVIILLFKSTSNIKLNDNQKKFINMISAILSILFLIWFIKFPLLRYGEGILVVFFTFVFQYIRVPSIKIDGYKFSVTIIIIFSLAVIMKNFSRIIKNYEKNYVDYPWPKKNSYTKLNLKNEYIPYKVNNEVIFYQPKIEARLCMYGSSPCAAIGVNETYFKIKKIKIKKGKLLFFKKYYITNKNK